jgi:membrane-bound lytic murein transglycosylase B
MIKFLLLLSITFLPLFATYKNCNFTNKNYTEICKRAVKHGVPVHDVNLFLLSTKAQKLNLLSFKLFNKKRIKTHRANEKKANNVLVKYIPKIIKHIKKYAKVYTKVETKYGVNKEIIASILMKETKLGKINPTFDAFEVFNTLVLKVKPKTKRDKWLLNMGKSNLVSIISYCYKKGYKPDQCNLPSSYAGAVGIPQFMPSSFIYVDSYKNRVGDLSKMEDAIMSAGKFLNKKAGFKKLIEWDKIPNMAKIEADWYEYDFKHKNGSFVYSKNTKTGKKFDCFSCKKDELKYLKKYIKYIMRYNNSSNYAVGVMRLAYDTHKGLN